jgi:hypothetical protein
MSISLARPFFLLLLVCVVATAAAAERAEWTPEMRRFRTTLVDHHPHRGRRLAAAEVDTCVSHFSQLQREVRLSILGHLFSDYAEGAALRRGGGRNGSDGEGMAPLPDALDRAVRAWEGSGRFAGSAPMKSWAKKDVHNGELKLLAHACVGTVLETPMWERIWGVLTSLEKDFVVVQWKGLVEHYYSL